MAVTWTDAQLRAITSRGGALLVSAAAGSGKTAVLVERVIRRLLDTEDPCNIDEFLIVTFTKAAAAEMLHDDLDIELARRARGNADRAFFEREDDDAHARFLDAQQRIGRLRRDDLDVRDVRRDGRRNQAARKELRMRLGSCECDRRVVVRAEEVPDNDGVGARPPEVRRRIERAHARLHGEVLRIDDDARVERRRCKA